MGVAPPGVVRDLAIALADGGKTIIDIETWRRREEALLDRAASEPTAWRTLEASLPTSWCFTACPTRSGHPEVAVGAGGRPARLG